MRFGKCADTQGPLRAQQSPKVQSSAAHVKAFMSREAENRTRIASVGDACFPDAVR